MGIEAALQRIDKEELAALRASPQTIEAWLCGERSILPKRYVDLDKDWHALHFLLTGSLEPDGTPVGDAILGGEPLGPDVGYGPVRVISADYAREIQQDLEAVDIRAAYQALEPDSADLSAIYCGFDFIAEEVNFLSDYFEQMKKLYAEAVREGQAVIAYLT